MSMNNQGHRGQQPSAGYNNPFGSFVGAETNSGGDNGMNQMAANMMKDYAY